MCFIASPAVSLLSWSSGEQSSIRSWTRGQMYQIHFSFAYFSDRAQCVNSTYSEKNYFAHGYVTQMFHISCIYQTLSRFRCKSIEMRASDVGLMSRLSQTNRRVSGAFECAGIVWKTLESYCAAKTLPFLFQTWLHVVNRPITLLPKTYIDRLVLFAWLHLYINCRFFFFATRESCLFLIHYFSYWPEISHRQYNWLFSHEPAKGSYDSYCFSPSTFAVSFSLLRHTSLPLPDCLAEVAYCFHRYSFICLLAVYLKTLWAAFCPTSPFHLWHWISWQRGYCPYSGLVYTVSHYCGNSNGRCFWK